VQRQVSAAAAALDALSERRLAAPTVTLEGLETFRDQVLRFVNLRFC